MAVTLREDPMNRAASMDRAGTSRGAMYIARVGAAIVCLVAILALTGLVGDLFDGFAAKRSAGSWPLWLGGLVLAGLIAALSDGAFDWVTSGDQTTDPLGRRVVRLVSGVLLSAAIVLIIVAVVVRLSA